MGLLDVIMSTVLRRVGRPPCFFRDTGKDG